ncbi:MAG: rhodanese-like domain-containing protein [Bacteroidota bacterium]|nr:rhodanese-like domain-containing protein [Bacteroidota bacterium]
MNRFIESNKPWLSLLGLAVIIVFLAFIFRPKPLEYQLGADQAFKLMNDQSMLVAVKDIGGKQLIDIRTSELFAQGHPENAINIPLRNLLDDEAIEVYDQLLNNGKEAVLYGSDELQATAPWLLLQQLGYKNLKILKGGLTPSVEFKETALSSTEKMVLDTAAIRIKPALAIVSETKSENKKSQAIIPVKKKTSSGGGC